MNEEPLSPLVCSSMLAITSLELMLAGKLASFSRPQGTIATCSRSARLASASLLSAQPWQVPFSLMVFPLDWMLG